MRGIRGATTAERNDAQAIGEATEDLLRQLIALNAIDAAEICFAYFTTTPDLDAEFPAFAARSLGWVDVPMLCGHEMDVRPPNPRGIRRCIRVLLLFNTERTQKEMRHAYLRGAQAIRAELDATRGRVQGMLHQ